MPILWDTKVVGDPRVTPKSGPRRGFLLAARKHHLDSTHVTIHHRGPGPEWAYCITCKMRWVPPETDFRRRFFM